MIISEIQSETRHCSYDGAKFKAPADFSHHAILLYDIVLKSCKIQHMNYTISLLSKICEFFCCQKVSEYG